MIPQVLTLWLFVPGWGCGRGRFQQRETDLGFHLSSLRAQHKVLPPQVSCPLSLTRLRFPSGSLTLQLKFKLDDSSIFKQREEPSIAEPK